jgi:hypothetical protein
MATQKQAFTLPSYFYLCKKKTIEIEKELFILSFITPDQVAKKPMKHISKTKEK